MPPKQRKHKQVKKHGESTATQQSGCHTAQSSTSGSAPAGATEQHHNEQQQQKHQTQDQLHLGDRGSSTGAKAAGSTAEPAADDKHTALAASQVLQQLQVPQFLQLLWMTCGFKKVSRREFVNVLTLVWYVWSVWLEMRASVTDPFTATVVACSRLVLLQVHMLTRQGAFATCWRMVQFTTRMAKALNKGPVWRSGSKLSVVGRFCLHTLVGSQWRLWFCWGLVAVMLLHDPLLHGHMAYTHWFTWEYVLSSLWHIVLGFGLRSCLSATLACLFGVVDMICWLWRAFWWLLHAAWQMLLWVLVMVGACIHSTMVWLGKTAPTGKKHLSDAWGKFQEVLWVIAALDLVSMPVLFAWLLRFDQARAVLVAVVQLCGAMFCSMVVGSQLKSCRTQASSASPSAAAAAAAATDLMWLVNFTWCTLLGNWFIVLMEAVASGSVLKAAAGACCRGLYVPNMVSHLGAHFVLAAAYGALLHFLQDLVLSKDPEHKLLQAEAWMRWPPQIAGALLRGVFVDLPAAVHDEAASLCGDAGAAWSSLRCACSNCMSGAGERVALRMRACMNALHAYRSNWGAACSQHMSAVKEWAASASAAAAALGACADMPRAAGAQAAVIGVQDSAMQPNSSSADSLACGAVGDSRQPSRLAAVAAAPAGPVAADHRTCKKHLRAGCTLHDCVVCLDAPRSVALLPCRHVVLCDGCFEGLKQKAHAAGIGEPPCCPLCRSQVQQHVGGLILA